MAKDSTERKPVPGAGGLSQAQSVAVGADDEAAAKPVEEAVEEGSAEGTGAESEVQYFDGTILKVTTEGDVVMSDHLMPGEKLKRAADEETPPVDPGAPGEPTPEEPVPPSEGETAPPPEGETTPPPEGETASVRQREEQQQREQQRAKGAGRSGGRA
jgi:hypothetical protein